MGSKKYWSILLKIILYVFPTNSEEITKIDSSLPECQGDDYMQWTGCFGSYKFPRGEYEGE